MKIHHSITLAAAVYNYTYGSPLPAMVLLSNEVSTVFYSASKLLPANSGARRVCRHLFGVTFFATRIVMNSMLMMKADAPLATTERGALAALLCLNAFWFGKGMLAS